MASLRRELGDPLFVRGGGWAVFRFQKVVVASPSPALRSVDQSALAEEPWLLGPSGLDRSTLAGAFLYQLGVRPEEVRAFPSMAAVLDRVAAGDALSIVYSHVARPAVERGRLAVLDVPGTPVNGFLYASTPGPDRRSPTAGALLRWITTPVATHVMLIRSSGVPMNRFRLLFM